MKIHTEELLEEKREQLMQLTQCVRPGRIVEFGCGSGFVLQVLSETFPSSTIVGVDKSMNLLKKVKKNLKNVIPVRADIIQKVFFDSTFDSALFVECLHEVFSHTGEKAVYNAVRMAYQILTDNGVLLIHDHLRPKPAPVEIVFKNTEPQEKFFKFAQEFRPRRIEYKEKNKRIKLDIADAVEFFGKYRSSSADWSEAMEETHLFFTEEEYQKMAHRTGFTIENVRKLPSYENKWYESAKGGIARDIGFTFDIECSLIQLVLKK